MSVINQVLDPRNLKASTPRAQPEGTNEKRLHEPKKCYCKILDPWFTCSRKDLPFLRNYI